MPRPTSNHGRALHGASTSSGPNVHSDPMTTSTPTAMTVLRFHPFSSATDGVRSLGTRIHANT